MALGVVTASLLGTAVPNWERYWSSWRRKSRPAEGTRPYRLVHVLSPVTGAREEDEPGPAEHLGVVPEENPELAEVVPSRTLVSPVEALVLGVTQALGRSCDPIAVFHDDLEMLEEGWDARVVRAFQAHPSAGLMGFGGALGLGHAEIYRKPYSPYDLAREDFVSNMRDAEVHGRRVLEDTRVACLDGFSLIGTATFWLHALRWLKRLGIRHHAYDSGLGGLAARLGFEVWMVPVRCHHAGGQTAVGNPRWEQHLMRRGSSDKDEWELSHVRVYEDLRDVLPLRAGWGRRV